MSSRARIFAAVTLLASCVAGQPAWAQVQNLEAGKSASQLFAGTCNACHKSPRGLLKTVSPGALPGFLREHYTTSGDMASQLASYLISNGASISNGAGDSRRAKQGSDKPGADKQGQGGNDQVDRQGRKNQEAVRPDDAPAPGEGGRQSRKRQARPGEAPEDARAPAQAAAERGPDGRRVRRSGKPGQPGAEEPPMANEPARTEPPKAESAKAEPGADDKPKAETLRLETGTAERAKPDADVKSNEGNSETVKIDVPKDAGASDNPGARRDPTPAAPPASSAAVATPAPESAPAPAAGSEGSSEQAVPQPASALPKAPAAPEPSAATASAPPPSSSGPPVPPISR